MRKLAFFGFCGVWFGAGPWLQGLPFIVSSLTLIAIGVALACAASERVHYLAIAAGSMGAFGSVALAGSAPALAGALLISGAFAERSTRIRTSGARIAHICLGLLGGALAGALAANFNASSSGIWWVATIVAVALASLPLLLDADDHIAYALDNAAAGLPPITKAILREAAELRRHSVEISLDEDTQQTVAASWSALIRLATAKARLEDRPQRSTSDAIGQVSEIVDTRIKGHLVALHKAFSAADAMKALETTSSDSALSSVSEKSESMDEVSRLLLEYEIEGEPEAKNERVQ